MRRCVEGGIARRSSEGGKKVDCKIFASSTDLPKTAEKEPWLNMSRDTRGKKKKSDEEGKATYTFKRRGRNVAPFTRKKRIVER